MVTTTKFLIPGQGRPATGEERWLHNTQNLDVKKSDGGSEEQKVWRPQGPQAKQVHDLQHFLRKNHPWEKLDQKRIGVALVD